MIEERLVIDLERAGRDRVAQIELKAAARLRLDVHFGLEEAPRSPPLRLGAVKRHVRVPEKLVGLFAVGRCNGDPDAGSDDDLMALHIERLCDRLDYACRKDRCAGRLESANLDNGKLISAEASDQISVTYERLQALGHRTEQRIADGVPQRIIDAFEPIQVEIEDGQILVAIDSG